MEVRSGQSTSFWFDIWSPIGRLIEAVGSRNGCIYLGIGIHETVASVLSNHRRRRHRVDLLNNIEDLIATTRQTATFAADLSLWKGKSDHYKSTFSSKDTWSLSRTSSTKCSWYKGVWFTQATPKYAFLTWLAVKNRLATGDRILRWNAAANSSCSFCGAAVESRDHIFFSCTYSAQVWRSLAAGILLAEFTTAWDRLLHLLTNIDSSNLCKFIFRYTFQAVIHSLWRERNRRRHGESNLPAITLSRQIDKDIRNKLSTLQRAGRCEEGLLFWFRTHP